MQRGRRRLVEIAVKTVVALAMTVIGFRVIDSYLDPFDDRPFDHAAWAAASSREQQRGPMARDALRQLPIGTPLEKVREMLGEGEAVPVEEDRWGIRPRQAATWEYWLGCWSGFGPYGFDSASLYVHFDSDGRVVAVEITGG